MKKFSQRSLLLFGAVLAVCAFMGPAMASAASWSVVGTTHQLFSSDLSFRADAAPPNDVTLGSICQASEFDVDVTSISDLRITGGSFQNCRGLPGLGANCTVTATGTGFPWTATAPNTTNIQIHGIHVDVLFEQTPGATTCGVNGTKITLTGTLSGGRWDPSAIGADRRVTYTDAPGVIGHGTSSLQALVTGTIRDTTGTLNLFD